MASSGSQDQPPVTFRKRASKPKTSFRKRPATPPPASNSDSDPDSEYSSVDEDGRKIKRRRKGAVISASSAAQKSSATDGFGASKFEADRSAVIEQTNDATKQSNWYEESGKDALDPQRLLGKTRARPAATEDAEEGVYRGAANYRSFIDKNPNAPERTVGPVKAPTNIRTITVTDYAPDVCKE